MLGIHILVGCVVSGFTFCLRSIQEANCADMVAVFCGYELVDSSVTEYRNCQAVKCPVKDLGRARQFANGYVSVLAASAAQTINDARTLCMHHHASASRPKKSQRKDPLRHAGTAVLATVSRRYDGFLGCERKCSGGGTCLSQTCIHTRPRAPRSSKQYLLSFFFL